MKLFNQLRWFFVREWKRYLGAILLLIIIATLQLLPPKIVGVLIDLIIKKNMHGVQILPWISIIFLVAVIVYILRYLWRILLFGASYQLATELRVKFYTYLSQQSQIFFLKNRTGDLIARATNDVDRVVFAAGEGVLTLVDSLVMGFSVLIVMSTQISFLLTIISLIPMPIMAILIKKYGKELHETFRHAQISFSLLNNQTQEILTSIRMIRAFGLEKNQSNKFNIITRNTGKKNMEVAKIDARFDPVIYLSVAFSNLLAIIGGGWLVWNNQISIGQLTSFIMYLGLMIWPMLALAWMFNIVERGSAAWDRIHSIINKKLYIEDGKNNIPPYPGILNINIKKFYYPNNQKPSLKDIRILIKPGNTLGICGPTGSGKSTLLMLIQRQFNFKKEEIHYHSLSLLEIKIDDWRRRIAVVNQTSFLFSDTISNNISLGKPNASQKEIEEVAKLADVHKDIIDLPERYETQVGERGVMLSGGQKQRVCIARALLLNAEILILDDALSAVDAQTENNILKNINEWKKKKHSLIITTHRLSALINSDEIIVIKSGSIIQRGNHLKLIQEKNWYKSMYYYQQSEIELEDNEKTGEKNL
ncbi:SmdA family multidrug ABC transporter permease/ATP-binding protein [Buchnera aphidicola]|uniref:SmdA family multidrug ABC transporter permease/ATP-binding protein n=1 Tax=Buchnera aphidicola TaxID=9 RepID=UPI000189C5E4|nr:SmdA family multidrug ABC transporter permease/ATP-binding protein [Buchnera aphidicola]ACL30273.1 multidrug resistance-like ATP-binding protein Mdl [Buchnera aphidicola str. Tuc7 (Acyrthosiphon pisum)]ADP66285.1 multidrug resistance-like ATP-binding protein Mdl [Buchnera aphidicola str. LL01 (Acyrthosiphon pisum)]ADP66862.1 multidrug resistance-like ATP-binding protein Mdl [Buchnera aphidicola str. TLW03 (Acyrthosiphon pisum)]ADP67449.1 multidrug resistance-like ATP-binding protein Mdl [Buc